MPPPRNRKDIPPQISAPHRRLVVALREVRACSDQTQREIAHRANQAATTLSNHLNGGRMPEIGLLTSFYEAVEEDARKAGRRMPHTLDTLLAMRHQALVKHCMCCSVGYPLSQSATEAVAQRQQEPAWSGIQRSARSPGVVTHFRPTPAHSLSGVPAQAKVPVPPAEGDRHPQEPSGERLIEENWSELRTLRRYLAEGRNRDAFVMLWSAATTLPSEEIPNVVSSCRSAGLDDEADTILTNAGRRDVQAVLNIASALHDRHLYSDAGVVLSAASLWQQRNRQPALAAADRPTGQNSAPPQRS